MRHQGHDSDWLVRTSDNLVLGHAALLVHRRGYISTIQAEGAHPNLSRKNPGFRGSKHLPGFVSDVVGADALAIPTFKGAKRKTQAPSGLIAGFRLKGKT
jgi:hypothetical protein